ncbi:MAG: DUF1565 domain-containing protein [Chitinivibrionales bacterium]|nr:DUF1565 domain-containing protein [Chitinivibrionales bacterium]
MTLFSPDSTYGEKLAALTKLGRSTTVSEKQIHLLTQLASSCDEDIRLCGYANWALDQCVSRQAPRSCTTFHVAADNQDSSDSNPGTAGMPFKTIQKAAQTARAGDTVIIHTGTYRECIQPFCGGDNPGTMITYCAAQNETPVIKAMDIWDPEWNNEGDGLWSAPYTPHPWDAPSRPGSDEPNNRCEQVFADNILLAHVKSNDECRANYETMWIDNAASRIFIHRANNQSPYDTIIERSVRQQCFAPAVRGLGHIRVKGLTMIGGAAHKWTGANWHDINQTAVMSIEGGHHWIIENNTILYGNAQGLSAGIGGFARPMKEIPVVTRDPDDPEKLPPDTFRGGTIVRNNCINYHGISGIVGIGDTVNLLIENNEVIGNDRKDNRGTCEEAGIKFHGIKKSVLRGNLVKDNDSHGIWLDCNCEENRVTRNIVIDNTDNQLFHELSEGPLLVDNNVILETKEKPASTGFYTHDGNRATLISNIISGCRLGVRVRALFHRIHHGKHTTTSDNHIYNTIIDNCTDGPISLMPGVSRCENNTSDLNILWNSGAPVMLRIENSSDVGMKWEETVLGRELGYCDGGDRLVPIESRARHLGHDANSITVCPRVLLGKGTPGRFRDILVRFSIKHGMNMENGYYPAQPCDAREFLGLCKSLGTTARLLRTVQTGPRSGFQIWKTRSGPRVLSWDHEKNCALHPLEEMVLLKEPIEIAHPEADIALGDSLSIPLEQQWRIVKSRIPCSLQDRTLVISAPIDSLPGDYAVVLTNDLNWTVIPVRLAPACTLDSIDTTISPVSALLATLTNHNSVRVEGTVEVTLNTAVHTASCVLDPHSSGTFTVPVSCTGAAKAHSAIRLGRTVIEREKLVSFAVAKRSDSWDECIRHDMDSFPDGLFPDGARDFVFYLGRLHAGWRARYDDTGLHVRVDVEHPQHIAKRLDMEGIHTGDGVKIALKGKPGDRATVIGMALISETLEQTYGFCKSGNESKYPVGRYPAMNASINRTGTLTVYETTITWDMINLRRQPGKGTSVPFSVLVTCKDSDAKYGLQWFYGIKYDEKEGDENWMGRLWFG